MNMERSWTKECSSRWKSAAPKNDVLTLRMTDIPWIEYVDPKASTNEEKKRVEEEKERERVRLKKVASERERGREKVTER